MNPKDMENYDFNSVGDEIGDAFDEGYRQGRFDALADLDKDSIVLSKEEYQRNLNNSFNFGREENKKYYDNYVIPQKIKEKVEKFAKTLISVLWEEEKDETIKIKDLHGVIRDVVNEQYGVDIKES